MNLLFQQQCLRFGISTLCTLGTLGTTQCYDGLDHKEMNLLFQRQCLRFGVLTLGTLGTLGTTRCYDGLDNNFTI